MPAPTAPKTWIGSKAEWSVYWALTQLHYQPDIDFIYQGNNDLMDFFLPAQRLAFIIRPAFSVEDPIGKLLLGSQGVRLENITEENANANPMEAVQRAIKGGD